MEPKTGNLVFSKCKGGGTDIVRGYNLNSESFLYDII